MLFLSLFTKYAQTTMYALARLFRSTTNIYIEVKIMEDFEAITENFILNSWITFI